MLSAYSRYTVRLEWIERETHKFSLNFQNWKQKCHHIVRLLNQPLSQHTAQVKVIVYQRNCIISRQVWSVQYKTWLFFITLFDSVRWMVLHGLLRLWLRKVSLCNSSIYFQSSAYSITVEQQIVFHYSNLICSTKMRHNVMVVWQHYGKISCSQFRSVAFVNVQHRMCMT